MEMISLSGVKELFLGKPQQPKFGIIVLPQDWREPGNLILIDEDRQRKSFTNRTDIITYACGDLGLDPGGFKVEEY